MPATTATSPGCCSSKPTAPCEPPFIDEYEILCAAGLWQSARTCSLADPQVFDDCLQTCTKDCYPETSVLAPWLVDCVDEPAVCE